jgi:hypothetical protein
MAQGDQPVSDGEEVVQVLGAEDNGDALFVPALDEG